MTRYDEAIDNIIGGEADTEAAAETGPGTGTQRSHFHWHQASTGAVAPGILTPGTETQTLTFHKVHTLFTALQGLLNHLSLAVKHERLGNHVGMRSILHSCDAGK